MIRVAVVDDHPIVTDGVVANLSAGAEIAVVATGTTADDALAIARAHAPDVLILDLELSGKSGLDAIPGVKAASPRTRIVIFSAYAGEERVAAAFERAPGQEMPRAFAIATACARLLAPCTRACRARNATSARIANGSTCRRARRPR